MRFVATCSDCAQTVEPRFDRRRVWLVALPLLLIVSLPAALLAVTTLPILLPFVVVGLPIVGLWLAYRLVTAHCPRCGARLTAFRPAAR